MSSEVATRMRGSRREKGAALLARHQSPQVLSSRQRSVLSSLAAYGDWARPMDVGAHDGSHHSGTLSALAARGLVDRKKLHAIYCFHGSTLRQKLVDGTWVVTDGHPPSPRCCCKGSCRYRITTAGLTAIGRKP